MATRQKTGRENGTVQAVTEGLVWFVTRTEFEDIPAQVILGAKFSFLDTLGICIGGKAERAPEILVRFAKETGGKEVSSVVGRGIKTTPSQAAWINGTSADVLGYSDISVAHMTHPSVSICPAVWAVAEATGATGRDILLAHVIGLEVANKLGAGVKPGLQIKGWHPLAILNTFGAAAASGKLLGLNEEEMGNAFGIAGAEASGIRVAMGTMSKAYGAGRSARDGVVAATLASMGFTGPRDVIEGRDGFLQTFGDGANGAGILENIGNPFEFQAPGLTYKAYPTCTRSHPGIKGVLDLKELHGISANDVVSIECAVSPAVEDYLKFAIPTTKLQAKYSMPFCVAVALVDGRVTLASITEDRMKDPEIVNLMKRTKMVVSPELAALGYAPDIAPYGCTIIINLKNGGRIEQRVDKVPWNPEEPPTWEDLIAKYRDCWESVLGSDRVGSEAINETIDIIYDLQDADRIDRLMDLVRELPGKTTKTPRAIADEPKAVFS